MLSSTQRLSSLGRASEGEAVEEAACSGGGATTVAAPAAGSAEDGREEDGEDEEAVPPLGEAYLQLWRVVRLPTVQASRWWRRAAGPGLG